MAKQFKFRDHRTEIKIEDQTFHVDGTDPKILRKLENFGREAQEQSFLTGEESRVEEVEKTMEFMKSSIDDILGEGASEDIFRGRSVSFFDMLDLLEFLKDQILTGQDEKFEQYSSKRVER